KKARVKHGVVQDKLWLPGLLKLQKLRDAGFFGRLLSVRGEFGYWVFEGDREPAQRPSWNYRKQDGGGIILDMLCHWRYVLDNLFGEVKALSCLGTTHIPYRWDENGKRYRATADNAAYATFKLAGGVIAHFNSSWAERVRRGARGAGLEELAAEKVARCAEAESMKRDTILAIKLPGAGGSLEDYAVREPKSFRRPAKPFTRRVLAAAHVVADPFSTREPWLEPAIDWEATIAYRRHLWSWGLGIAEAMDTAQRGMGLDWPSSLELIKKTLDAARDAPGAFVASGAAPDHLSLHKEFSIEEIISAYEAQCASIEKLGGRIILMASRALAARAKSPE